MSPLKEIVDSIHSQVAKIEDDLKVIIVIWIMEQLIVNWFVFYVSIGEIPGVTHHISYGR